MTKLADGVLGIVGSQEPTVCALTGRPVAGKHSAHVYIDGAYYVCVLSSHYEGWSLDRWQEIRDIVVGKGAKTAQKGVSDGDRGK